MPLIKVPFKPGFNKQLTKTTAEYQWTDGDFVRFRYGEPEKMGGWNQPLANTLPGVARDIHNWSALDGTKYIAIGTTKGLFLYFEGAFYDISPLGTALASCTFTTTNGSATVTVNKTSHDLTVGEYVVFTSVSLPGSGTGFATSDFTTNPFEVITVPNANSFTITMTAVESGSGISAGGSATTTPYAEIGPTIQTLGFGWGTGTWSGSQNWGEASTTDTTTLEPGNWSLDNYGQILIATIRNGKSFEWDPSASNALTTRATAVATNPTASVHTIVSDTDRHLIHLGTETTIGTPATQDKMFIRFSDQEDRTTYAPTSTNTAGTFQLDSGSKIVGAVRAKDLTFIVTDTSAYIMQFVGPPFTFSIRQVGTNCGAMSQHSIIHVDGVVYWMGRSGGFFVYDGAGVKKIPCSVEDFVFTTQTSDDLGFNFNQNEIVFAGFNALFTEINWFYPKAGSDVIDRCVTLNYREGVWTTSSLDRTTYIDKFTFDNPYATQYSLTATPNFSINGITNTYGATTLYEHEVGTDQVDSAGSKTAIPAFIESGDFSLDMEGAQGEFFLKIRRFIPDFAKIDGNAKVSLLLKDFPAQTETSSSLGPFTVTASTNKIDTRARGRFAALKIENESTDETWRFGSFRADVQPDGRR